MRGSVAIFGICIAVLSACGGDSNDGSDNTFRRAQVRVVQAVIDAPALDVYIATSARLPAFPNIASGTATGYVGLDQGTPYQFIVRQAGDPDILAQLDLTLSESERRLLFVSGARTPAADEQPITITAFDDARVDLGPGLTQMRVVNAILEGTPIEARVAGESRVLEANAEAVLAVAANEALPTVVTWPPPPPSALPPGTTVKAFTTPALASATDVIVAVIGASNPGKGDARALRLLNIPAVGISNTTVTSTTQPNPTVIFVNGVPGGDGALVVDGGTERTVPFAAVSLPTQVSTSPRLTLDGEDATLNGALDAGATYLVVIAQDPSGGITMFAYRDTLADAAETRIRAINATIGSGARDVALSPAPVLGSDLVFGAASSSGGTVVNDPAAVTAITATATSGAPFVYPTTIAAATRYVVLVGDAASDFGAVVIASDWSASFVAAD